MTESEKVSFGVEHIRAVCPDPKLPPKIEPDRLRWAWRLNAPDLVSTHQYRWPFPGHWAKARGPFSESTDPCPSHVGDGLCLARTISGAQSGGQRFASSVALLVAFLNEDVLAQSDDKLRVKQCWVADTADPLKALVSAKANLTGADLTSANLTGADLRGADLRGAYLTGADLTSANLRDAYLTGANLTSANLTGANLTGAYLRGANLRGADLRGADLRGADLRGADLRDANLRDAYLTGADLRGATYTQLTLWPGGFDPIAAGATEVRA